MILSKSYWLILLGLYTYIIKILLADFIIKHTFIL